MKRMITKKFETIKRKTVLCLMLAGFAAMNLGFTEKEEEIPSAQIELEETSANEPTAIAVGENGKLQISENDELIRAYAELVENSLGKELIENLDTEEIIAIEEVEPVEEPIIDASNEYADYADVIDMEATAYLPTDGDGACITAMGIPATYGIVAVDPNVIPLGSRVYIPGYGEALAADTGGAIYGNRIDLCMEDYYEAMEFGRRYVTVFVLK